MKKEINESYEDQVLKEFEETQPKEEPKTITNLGNIRDNKSEDDEKYFEEEISRVGRLRDYHNIPLDCLPSLGRFYPENTQISIRAARVDEIREFSAIDENNPKDVIDKLTYMV